MSAKLFEYIEKGQTKNFNKELAKISDINVIVKDSRQNNNTALIVAIMMNRSSMVQAILKKGADLSIVPNEESGWNAIHTAIMVCSGSNGIKIVKAVLTAPIGSNLAEAVNAVDKEGRTPMDVMYLNTYASEKDKNAFMPPLNRAGAVASPPKKDTGKGRYQLKF